MLRDVAPCTHIPLWQVSCRIRTKHAWAPVRRSDASGWSVSSPNGREPAPGLTAGLSSGILETGPAQGG